MKWLLVLCAMALGLPADAAASREVYLIHEEYSGIRFGGVGPAADVSSLQELAFALEYDPDLVTVDAVGLQPSLATAPDQFDVQYLAGRVEVRATWDTPTPLDAYTNDALFTVSWSAADDWYEGERVPIRTVGITPGVPPSWIDDPENPDDIKVVVTDLILVGTSGITCLAGDALGDGRVDAGDSGTVLRIVAGLIEAPGVMMRCGADINRDGYIYAGDAVRILRKAAGFNDPLPRVESDPRAELQASPSGAILRVTDAAVAFGATVRVRAVGAVALEDLRSTSAVPGVVRVDADEAVLALADLEPVADADGSLTFRIDAAGNGRVVVEGLSLFDATGELFFETTDPLSVELSGPAPLPRVALGNTPNPFNPVTTFWMELPREGRATLALYDMRGRRLATLLDEVRPAGRSEFRFDGQSLALSSGVYFARLETAAGATVHRITLLK